MSFYKICFCFISFLSINGNLIRKLMELIEQHTTFLKNLHVKIIFNLRATTQFPQLTNCSLTTCHQQLQSTSPGSQLTRKQKRFKTNNNTSLTSPQSDTENNNNNNNTPATLARHRHTAHGLQQMARRFFFKPHLVYKCQLCSRRMSTFDYNHWLQHDLEGHHSLYTKSASGQHFSCFSTSPFRCCFIAKNIS